MKTYYELLTIEATADPEEVKRAFRREIARYHPDKVQHLGPEFQEIAATRAAELTEAYRILMDPTARQSYDASLESGTPQTPQAAASADKRAEPSQSAAAATATPPRTTETIPHAAVSESLRQTQETLSQFVRKATIGRLREGVEGLFGAAEPLPIDGFDAAFLLRPRRGIFHKAEPPVTLVVRVTSLVDGTTVQEAWPLAVKAGRGDAMVCLLLLGQRLSPARDLAAAIAEQRRRSRQAGPVVIPVDSRDWNALIPPETPSSVRKLLERLKPGA